MRLFFSCVDVGSLLQNVAIIDGLRSLSPNLQVLFVTDGAASAQAGNILGGKGLENLDLSGYDPRKQKEIILRELRQFSPDFGFVGLSVERSKIDESSVETLKSLQVPSGVLQDYWGYLGKFSARCHPDYFFVIDQIAADLTRAGMGKGVDIIVTGSPKHLMYRKEVARWAARNPFPDSEDFPILFVCQPDFISGIMYNFRAFCRTISRTHKERSLFVRLHPADRRAGGRYVDTASVFGLRTYVLDAEGEIEPFLLHAAIVATCFSTSGLDHAYLQLVSSSQLGKLVYLHLGQELQQEMKLVIGMPHVPGVESGLGTACKSEADIERILQVPLERWSLRYASAVQENLGCASSAINEIYRIILQNQN